MKMEANAKINLALNVSGTRDNGYHDIESIMVPLELHDDIYLSVADEDSITANVDTIPLDDSNLGMKAIKLMRDMYHLDTHYHLHIDKYIPSEAGLGGGSSDAAAVMKLINEMEHLGISEEELANLSVKIGADCPYCIYNRPCMVKGIGDEVTPFTLEVFPYEVLLVKPASGVSTRLAYEELDMGACDHPKCDEILEKLEKREYLKLNLANSLEESALRINKDVLRIKVALLGLGFDYVLMSGSGACVFGLTKSKNLLDESYDLLKENFDFVEKSKIVSK